MRQKFIFSKKAYFKCVFHSYKYFSQAVNGIFLGKNNEEENTITIEDSIPMSHGIASIFSLEVYSNLLKEYSSELGLTVIGFYYANEIINNNFIEPIAQKIVDVVHPILHFRYLFFLDAAKLSQTPNTEIALRIYCKSDNQKKEWKEDLKTEYALTLDSQNGFIELEAYLNEKKNNNTAPLYHNVFDMEDHFNMISNDWTNSKLFEQQ